MINQSDRLYFQKIVKDHYTYLKKFIYIITLDKEITEFVVEETLSKAWVEIRSVKKAIDVKQYLCRLALDILRNKCSTEKSIKIEISQLKEYSKRAAALTSIAEFVGDDWDFDNFQSLLNGLTVETFQVLILHYYYELSIIELYEYINYEYRIKLSDLKTPGLLRRFVDKFSISLNLRHSKAAMAVFVVLVIVGGYFYISSNDEATGYIIKYTPKDIVEMAKNQSTINLGVGIPDLDRPNSSMSADTEDNIQSIYKIQEGVPVVTYIPDGYQFVNYNFGKYYDFRWEVLFRYEDEAGNPLSIFIMNHEPGKAEPNFKYYEPDDEDKWEYQYEDGLFVSTKFTGFFELHVSSTVSYEMNDQIVEAILFDVPYPEVAED